MTDDGRRKFLKVVAVSATAAAGAPLLSRCGWSVNPAPEVTADAPDNAGQIKFSKDAFTALAAVGGAVRVASPGAGQEILLMHTAENEYKAVSALCTHEHCPLGYIAQTHLIECPCHGARFTVDGAVLRRPAVAPLDNFPVIFDAQTGQIIIDSKASDRTLSPVVNGAIALDVSAIKSLKDAGSSLAYTPRGLGRPIIIVRVDAATFRVFDANCTFAPCVVELKASAQRLVCPCHGDEFNLGGQVTKGPATVGLKTYVTAFDGKTLTISV